MYVIDCLKVRQVGIPYITWCRRPRVGDWTLIFTQIGTVEGEMCSFNEENIFSQYFHCSIFENTVFPLQSMLSSYIHLGLHFNHCYFLCVYFVSLSVFNTFLGNLRNGNDFKRKWYLFTTIGLAIKTSVRGFPFYDAG